MIRRMPIAPPTSPWSTRLSSLLPAIVFVAVLAIAGVHYKGQTLARGPDQADMLLAFFHEASHAIAEEGVFAAMYTEGVRAGESNWSNPNYHMLYPFYLNWTGADASPEATLDRLNLVVLLHLALLAAGASALARALGARPWAALLVGLAIPWFPAVRSAAGWPHIIAGMAWIPWVLAAQVQLFRDRHWRRQLRGALGLALAASLLTLAHPAQNLVFAAWATAWLWLLVAVQVVAARNADALRAFLRGSAWVAAGGMLALTLCWPFLGEILAFHARSIRWLGEVGGFIIGDQPVPAHALRFHALAPADAGLVLAFEQRLGIGHAYLGAAVLVAALGVLARGQPGTPEQRSARALLACGLVALAFCFAPLATLLAGLPLANRVRELTWWSCLAVLLLVPLVPLGLDALRQRPPTRRTVWPWITAACFLAALAATLASGVAWRATAVLLLLPAFAPLAWLAWPRPRTALPAHVATVACAILLAATLWVPFQHNIRFARADAMLFQPDRVQAHADAAALAARLPARDRYRFFLSDRLDNAHLLTHAWTLHGFRSIHGGIGPTEYAKYMLLSQANPAVAAMYGVRWSLWPTADARAGDEPLRPGLVLRTHEDALPRLYLLGGGLELSEDPVGYLRGLGTASPLRAVVRPVNLPPGFDAATLAGEGRLAGTVTVHRNARTRIEALVETGAPGLLVLNEDPAARWRATVDGRRVRMFRVNGYQTALLIPGPGRYEVRIQRPGPLLGGV